MTDELDLERRLELADQVADAVAGLAPAVAVVVASALRLDDGPLRQVGDAFESICDGSRRRGGCSLARQIRRLARFGDQGLLDRLAAAEAEPWRTLSSAIAAERASTV